MPLFMKMATPPPFSRFSLLKLASGLYPFSVSLLCFFLLSKFPGAYDFWFDFEIFYEMDEFRKLL